MTVTRTVTVTVTVTVTGPETVPVTMTVTVTGPETVPVTVAQIVGLVHVLPRRAAQRTHTRLIAVEGNPPRETDLANGNGKRFEHTGIQSVCTRENMIDIKNTVDTEAKEVDGRQIDG